MYNTKKEQTAVMNSLIEIFGGGSRLSDDDIRAAIEIGQDATQGKKADLDIMTIVTDRRVLDHIIDSADTPMSSQELRDDLIDYLINRLNKIKRMRV